MSEVHVYTVATLVVIPQMRETCPLGFASTRRLFLTGCVVVFIAPEYLSYMLVWIRFDTGDGSFLVHEPMYPSFSTVLPTRNRSLSSRNYRVISPTMNPFPPGPYRRPVPRVQGGS